MKTLSKLPRRTRKELAALWRQNVVEETREEWILYCLGMEAYYLRNFRNARNSFASLTASSSREVKLAALEMLAVLDGEQGRDADHVGRFHEILKVDPHCVIAKYTIAEAELERGRPDTAEQLLLEAFADVEHRRSESLPDVQFLASCYARVLRALGRNAEAKGFWDEVVERYPERDELRRMRDAWEETSK